MKAAKAQLSVVTPWSLLRDRTSDAYIMAEAFMDKDLKRSGLCPADMDSKPVVYHLEPRCPAYIIPYPDSDGHWRIRLDLADDKYRSPQKTDDGSHVRAYFPVGVTRKVMTRTRAKFICEGEKKATAFHKASDAQVCAIGGCWMFAHKVNGVSTLIADIQHVVRAGDHVTYIADRDILDHKKFKIAQAADRLRAMLQALNCQVQILVPPEPYKGIDDWLVDGHTDLEELEEYQSSSLFPIELLIKEGMRFGFKDGVPLLGLGYKDMNNSVIAARLIVESDKDFLTADKYLDIRINEEQTSMAYAIDEAEVLVNRYMPKLPVLSRGIAHAVERYVTKCVTTDNCLAAYIRGLTWDKIPRLETWLPQVMVMGDKTPAKHAAAVGKILMCALYSRITSPGCKQDFMFVLSGPQSIGKTTFWQKLGEFPMYNGYRTTDIERIRKSDFTNWLNLKQAVVLDFDDVARLGRGAQEVLKSFVTHTHDTGRRPYSQQDIDEPRGFVITGSSNNTNLLSDPTGARRYLVLDVADIRGVTGPYKWGMAVRDQLLAEVHARWAELKDNWWEIDLGMINAAAARFNYESDLILALSDLWENQKLAKLEKHGHVVTGAVVKAWVQDETRLDAFQFSKDLRSFVDSPTCPFIIGKEVMVYTDALMRGLEPDIARLYATSSKKDRQRVFTIAKR